MPQKKSLAMVLTGAKTFARMDLPVPSITADTALMRVEACGICGSDYEQYEGVLNMPMNVIPGHEPIGFIEAIGDNAARRWGVNVGDRVAVETMISCRFCPPCLGGRYHLCENRRIYSYIPISEGGGLWGGYAEYMVLDPNTIVHRLDKSLPTELAVMFNPLGAGFRWAVEIPQTKPGDTVVIMGPGQRGLSSVAAVKAAGAGKVIVTGLEADRTKLEIAKLFGADHTIDVQNEKAREKVKQYTNGKGADVVIDVSAYATEPVTDALSFVRPGGTIVLAGVKGFKPVPGFVSDMIVMKEITIKGAMGVTWSGYASAIELLEKRSVPFEKMHTHDFDLLDAELAIKTLARQIPGDASIHTCLIPNLK
ncbi:MAG: alcohol dehydrogenase [Alphaproteobacteria bacterium]|nr:alcohol dehydrogenase [Alphaproteobacteria bacterium]